MNTTEINVTVAEKNLIEVVFTEVDRIGGLTRLEDSLALYLIYDEEPTRESATLFSLSNDYVSGSLRVFFNGLREKNIVEVSASSFSMPVDTIVADNITVDYLKDSE